ncbi:MAG: flippase-like domain-containing protein [Leptolyngbyaceae cyanobacterium RU_5_1]|nr:flippase-like domain-containing protein [Leptolyngbyaceae cyanobacterium RU_5_1]
MNKFLARRTVPLLVGAIIFFVCLQYIVRSFQWMEIIQIIKSANLVWLLGAGALSILIFCLLRTWRWFILLKNLNIRINYIDLHLCNAASMSLTIITPFQSGEVVKVELLKRSGLIERFSGYSSFITERVIDLLVIVSIAVISLLINFDLGINKSTIIYAWVLLLLLLATGIFIIHRVSFKGKLGRFLSHLRQCTRNTSSLLLVILLTFCAWAMVVIGWQICLYSISIDLGFQKSIALMSVTTLINILSFVPGAVGVSEVGITEVLSRMGLTLASAQAGAFVLRFYSILVILVGAVHFLLWKILRNRRTTVARAETRQK